MIAPLMVSHETSLILAVIIGFFFGLFLQRAGLGDPHRLTGVFYLTDFAMAKVMFTAILVASSGLYLLSDLNLLDLDRIWIVQTYFWPQTVGGLIFGIGFVISGYCPGTAVAGLAAGRLDALITMIGIGIGSLIFAVLFPLLEGFYQSSAMGAATIPDMLGISHWIVLTALFVAAGLMFFFTARYEKKAG